jgi:hypothetical protein
MQVKTTRSGQKAIMREDPCWNWGAYDAVDSDDCETKKDEERAGSAAYTCG